MDKRLVRQLGNKTVLKTLKTHYQKNMTVPSHSDRNIFYLLIQHDRSIGYKSGKQVFLHEGGWGKIATIVKSVTGFDLLTDDVGLMTTQGRVENSLIMNNEKSLSTPPTLGFLMCRLMGSDYDISEASNNFATRATADNSYEGLHINTIKDWVFDALIIVENFAAFIALNSSFIDTLIPRNPIQSTLVVYRGHNKQGVYGVTEEIASIKSEKYVFADYDLSGLSLAEIIASKINASGYILPRHAEKNPALARLSKRAEYIKQSRVVVHDVALASYSTDIHNRFLAVTQEAVLAHHIPMAIVRRGIAANES